MKKFITLCLFVLSLGIFGQSPYEKGMQKAFSLWGEGKTTQASQLFERISKVEKDNWIPNYYVAQLEIQSAFNTKDEATLKAKLDKAQQYIDTANSLSENNPELLITQALLHTAYINFDGQKYGMTMSGKNSQLYKKALELAPDNPRVILGYAEWNMGAARFFGKSTKPYCDQVKKAIEVGKTEKLTEKFYPRFQVKRAEAVLKQCQG
ncbi:MAG: hypothetical protein CMB99_05050 [Flavobacteriaceae bacterium]|nr:hypothetical protein [Flavobacteriaceae bacterium]|tara:strand:+ start:90109 stop:90732 length:624 start_codon:yes stop_codon:yes gene_type:complete